MVRKSSRLPRSRPVMPQSGQYFPGVEQSQYNSNRPELSLPSQIHAPISHNNCTMTQPHQNQSNDHTSGMWHTHTVLPSVQNTDHALRIDNNHKLATNVPWRKYREQQRLPQHPSPQPLQPRSRRPCSARQTFTDPDQSRSICYNCGGLNHWAQHCTLPRQAVSM